YRVAAFSVTDMQTVMSEAQTLVLMIRDPRADLFWMMSGKERLPIRYNQEEVKALADIARTYGVQDEHNPLTVSKRTFANRFIKRAAMLETDVAMLGGQSAAPVAVAPS